MTLIFTMSFTTFARPFRFLDLWYIKLQSGIRRGPGSKLCSDWEGERFRLGCTMGNSSYGTGIKTGGLNLQ